MAALLVAAIATRLIVDAPNDSTILLSFLYIKLELDSCM